MTPTTPARILTAVLLAGVSGCALLFNFGDYGGGGSGGSGGSGGGGSGGGSGIGGNSGSSSSGIGGGQSSGSPSSVSSAMCEGPTSTSSGMGGSGSIQISGLLDDDIVAMEIDTAGNIVIAGTFKGSVDVGGVVHDVGSNTKRGLFLAQLDPSGATKWSKLLATSPDSLPLTAGVAIDPADNSIAIAGSFGDTVDFGFGAKLTTGGLDAFVAQYAQQGGIMWSHVYGGPGNVSATGVTVDSARDIVITGRFEKYLDTDKPAVCVPMDAGLKEDAFIAKHAFGNGACTWLVRTNGSIHAHADGIAADASGNTYVSGAFKGALKPGVVPDLTAAGMQGDTFLVKYGANGVPAFAIGLAPAGDATVVFDPLLGALLLSGSATGAPYGQPNQLYGGGTSDILAARYTTAGMSALAKIFGGPGAESAQVVALPDGSGKLVMAGTSQGLLPLGMLSPPCSGGLDAFVAQLDDMGTPIAAKVFGDSMNQSIRFVRAPAASPGSIVVAGSFQGTIDIGQGPLNSLGGYDIFIGTIPVPQP